MRGYEIVETCKKMYKKQHPTLQCTLVNIFYDINAKTTKKPLNNQQYLSGLRLNNFALRDVGYIETFAEYLQLPKETFDYYNKFQPRKIDGRVKTSPPKQKNLLLLQIESALNVSPKPLQKL